MIKLVILHAFTSTACCIVADKISAYRGDGHAFESRTNFFLFFNSKIFYDLIKNSRFSMVARLILSPYSGYYLVSFIWLGEKISLKYLFIGWGSTPEPLAFLNNLWNKILKSTVHFCSKTVLVTVQTVW